MLREGRMEHILKLNNCEEKPYERFLRFGPEFLTEAELLAIIIRTGTKEADATELAKQVLALTKFPRKGLLGLYDLSVEDYMRVKGIGFVKAAKLRCITEFAMRLSTLKAQESFVFNNTKSVADYLMEMLRHNKNEGVFLLSLDCKGKLINTSKLSDGSVNMALISPRSIFLRALKEEAVSIILAHNHPSGDPTPSDKDIVLTREVYNIGNELGIPLLDHIIIGDNIYASFRELNLI